jgi:hypothetical protein
VGRGLLQGHGWLLQLVIGSAVGERVARAAKGREDGIKGRGGRGMDETAQWKQVDAYMVKGGFFDTAEVGVVEARMAEFAGQDYKIMANACKWVIHAKKKGTYQQQQNAIRVYSKHGVPFAQNEQHILWTRSLWSDPGKEWFLAAYVACASATARVQREAAPEIARKKLEAEYEKAATKGYLPSIAEAHFELMRACLGRM